MGAIRWKELRKETISRVTEIKSNPSRGFRKVRRASGEVGCTSVKSRLTAEVQRPGD